MSEVSSGDVLFVGSVPSESTEDVFRRCAQAVGHQAYAFPDGELGPRQMWIGGLGDMVYSKHPSLERLPGTPLREELYAVRGGQNVSFDELYPYAAYAIESYGIFRRLRDAGELPADSRFQVSLPTAHAAIAWFFDDHDRWPDLLGAWAHAMRHGYDAMLAEIRAEDLAIQLDFCSEVVDASGAVGEESSLRPGGTQAEKVKAYTDPGYLVPMSENLPESVRFGYHLCLGTDPQWPVAELENLELIVALANGLIANTPRRVDFLHLPVMEDADDAYFAPLRDLTPGPKVFLGLECRDGRDGLQRRMETARRYLPEFGIAHFCGYGREYVDQIDGLLADLSAGAQQLRGASSR